MRYTLLWEDEAGESHFDDVEVEDREVEFAPPAPPFRVAEMGAGPMLVATVPAGWTGGWHPAPARQFFVVLGGVAEVTVTDGETRRFTAGDLGQLEDVAGRGHLTRVVGDEDLRLVFVQIPG